MDHQDHRYIEMLILQSTPFCNIDCSYCYLPDRASKQRMSDATLARAFETVLRSPFLAKRLTVVWHAGEPLVPGVDYYEHAFDILARLLPKNLEVEHSFQTNATLLDERWAEFLEKHAVKVGISVDGPAELHNRHRRTRRGGGTFDQTMRGIRVLQAHAYPFHVITVLTKESLKRPRELFDFYVASGITQIAFNVEEIEGGHRSSSLLDDDTDRLMHEFLETFFDLVEAHPVKLEVREFASAFGAIVNPQTASYGNPLAEPLRTISVAVNGDIGTFAPELLGYGDEPHGSFIFGNVHRGEIADVLNDPKFLAVNAEIERGLNRCRDTCEYFEICLGGSPANKLFENGAFDSTETMFCRLAKKAVIDVVLGRIESATDPIS